MADNPRPDSRVVSGIVPQARWIEFAEPAQFLAFESELRERVARLLDAGAVDDGTAHALDRAIEQERLRARAALIEQRNQRLARLGEEIARCDGEVARLTWIINEQTERWDRLRKQVDEDRAEYESSRRPESSASASARNSWLDKTRELKREAKLEALTEHGKRKTIAQRWWTERKKLRIARKRARLERGTLPPPPDQDDEGQE